MSYLKSHGTRQTPQSQPMRADQIENSADGFVWEIDKWARLQRFLILGSEGGSYYASEKELTFQNVQCLRECLAEDGPRFVEEVVAVSEAGRAPKNDPALFALANAISIGDKNTRHLAAEALPRVARIGTHLYHFIAFAETMRGWGRTMRWAVSNWYAQNPENVALQAIKYRQRDGWSHRDVLRRAHPELSDRAAKEVLGFISGNVNTGQVLDERNRIVRTVKPWKPSADLPPIIEGYMKAQAAKSPKETAALVREYNLPREALLSEHLNDVEVWTAMLEKGMPLGAMVRNVATMTRNGTFENRENRHAVADALADADKVKRSRLHPLAILVGLRTYTAGRGFRGSNSWNPIADISDALDEAFYLAFDNVEPTGKSHMLALDVSGSMSGGMVAGSPLTPREASAAMALVTLHAEKDVAVMGFATQFVPLGISRRQRLDDAVRAVSGLPFGGTDCALPMVHAKKEKWGIESFVVYTDSETWFGRIHPKQALDQYRQASNIPSSLVVVGMVANRFSIADPNDAKMLDCVGMDTATPAVIADFIRG